MPLSTPARETVAICVVAVCLLGTAAYALVVLWRRRESNRLSTVLTVLTCILILLNTTHFALNVISGINSDATMKLKDQFQVLKQAGLPLLSIEAKIDKHTKLANAFLVAKAMVDVFNIFILDGMMSFRCYKLYCTFRVVVVPVALSVTSVALAIKSFTVTLAAAQDPLRNISELKGTFWFVAGTLFYPVSFVTSVVTSGFVIGKIWRTYRRTERTTRGGSALGPVLKLIVASAVIQIITLGVSTLVVVITPKEISPTRVTIIANSITPPLLGIAFCLLIIRVGNKDPDETVKTAEIRFHMPTVMLESADAGTTVQPHRDVHDSKTAHELHPIVPSSSRRSVDTLQSV